MTRHHREKPITDYPPSALRSYCDDHMRAWQCSLSDARESIQDAVGREIAPSVFNRWLNGAMRVPDDVRTHCIAVILPVVLKKHGVRIDPLIDDKMDLIAMDLR